MDTMIETKLFLASLGISVAVVFILNKIFRPKTVEEKEEPLDPKYHLINFMYWEKSTGLQIPSVATISFYPGEVDVEKIIQEKLLPVLQKNSWLAARLVLRYSAAAKKKLLVGQYLKDFDEAFLKDYFQKVTIDNSKLPEDEKISENSSMDTIMKFCQPFLVKKGADCFKAGGILFKVVFVKILDHNTSNNRVECVKTAFIISLSHVLGDGHTFYRLYSMFDSSTKITALDPERLPSYPEDLSKVQPIKVQNYLQSVPLILTVLKNSFFGEKPKYLVYRVNQQEIHKQKKDYQSSKSSAFISTNDILSSWFFQQVKSNFGFIAINCRNRLKHLNLTNDRAGNFQTFILYSAKDFANAADIRYSYDTFLSKSNAFPSFLETLQNRVSGISNWATFYSDVKLPIKDTFSSGAGPRYQTAIAHLPLFHQDYSPLKDFMFIFQLNAKETGVLIFSRTRNDWQEWLNKNPSLLLPLFNTK
jgi:hypothetical protein